MWKMVVTRSVSLEVLLIISILALVVGGMVGKPVPGNKKLALPSVLQDNSRIYQMVQRQLQIGLTKFVTGVGALGCDEQVLPISQLWVDSWYYDNYQDVNQRRQWNDFNQDSTWSNSQLFEALLQSSRPTDDVDLNCWNYAFDAYKNWNSSMNPLYYQSLDVPTWETNFDAGEYGAHLSFQFNVSDPSTQQWQYVNFTATSFVRVDVKPREWYTSAFPFLIRNARPSDGGLCGSQRMYDCFFKEGTGLWTAITTGLIIVSGCTVQTSFNQGNGTTTCQPDQPYIAGHIIQRMPVRDSFCPCAGKRPYITPFCTAPWKTSSSEETVLQ